MSESNAVPLLLSPLSSPTRRVWATARNENQHALEHGSNALKLQANVFEQDSFSACKAIISHVRAKTDGRFDDAFRRISGHFSEVAPNKDGTGSPTAHTRLLATSVAQAVMRRISRESVFTSRLIDLAARTLNDALGSLPNCDTVVVSDVDRIDRPSLKVLARAMLLLENSHGFSWLWEFNDSPCLSGITGSSSLTHASRQHLFASLNQMLRPTLRLAPLVKHREANSSTERKTLSDISVALVLQNYDACIDWCLTEIAHDNPDSNAIRRLMALAAVNIGAIDFAMNTLRAAENTTSDAPERAHLCYLQGLIQAKRIYCSEESDEHYARGLSYVDECNNDSVTSDLAVEKAWLLNGIALNAAMSWRRGDSSKHQVAMSLLHEAFSLVRNGGGDARVYLRANLLANSTFLLEMVGKHALAAKSMAQAFEGGSLSKEMKRRWDSTLGYRLGVLELRAGNVEEAKRRLEMSVESLESQEDWPLHERATRALGYVYFTNGEFSEAAKQYAAGFQTCRMNRSRIGSEEHLKGLSMSMQQLGKEQRANEILEEFSQTEGIDLNVGAASFPSPKLPAYIPEIDLEDIPGVDLNRVLAGIEAEEVVE